MGGEGRGLPGSTGFNPVAVPLDGGPELAHAFSGMSSAAGFNLQPPVCVPPRLRTYCLFCCTAPSAAHRRAWTTCCLTGCTAHVKSVPSNHLAAPPPPPRSVPLPPLYCPCALYCLLTLSMSRQLHLLHDVLLGLLRLGLASPLLLVLIHIRLCRQAIMMGRRTHLSVLGGGS